MDQLLEKSTPYGCDKDQLINETVLTTFPIFPKLPVELRLKVWKAACFPRTTTDHGLHYVTVNSVEEVWDDEDTIVTLNPNLQGYDEELEVERYDTAYVKLQAFKRPQRRSATLDTSAKLINSSAYLWDAGLWTAYVESRIVITKELDLMGWSRLRNGPGQDTSEWYDRDFPSTLIPHVRDGMWRPITFPTRDIYH
uniref:2EXR domain-containing protein n=1 Tax=Gibberella zeae TaxID=5518 RepID=A0A4E9DWY7_GIBZA